MPVPVIRTMPFAFAFLAAVLGLVSVVAPLVAIAAAFAIAFVVIMLQDLAVGLALFAFSASFFEAVPELAEFSLAKGIGLLLALSWIASQVVTTHQRRQLPATSPGFSLLLIILLGWCVLSVLWAADSATTLSSCLRLALNVLLVPIAYTAIQEPKHVRWLVGAFLAGVIGSTLFGLASGAAASEEGRLTGTGLDPNYLALFLVVAASLAIGLVFRRESPPHVRLVAGIGALVCLLAIVPTGSRTGLVALAVVAAVSPAVLGRGRRIAAILVGLAAIAALVVYFVAFASPQTVERITHPGTGSGRTDIWRVGWRMVEANPVAGVGLGNFQQETIHYLLEPGAIQRTDYIIDHPKVAHNLYLEVTAEVGVVGLALYLIVVVLSAAAAIRAARIFDRLGRRSDALQARAIVLAIAGVAGGSAFVSVQYTKPLWILLALGPAVLGMAARAARPETTR